MELIGYYADWCANIGSASDARENRVKEKNGQ